MRKIRNMIIALVLMIICSLVCLLIVSIFAYNYKWQADKALVGITITYILAGFAGGLALRFLEKSEKGIGQKMLEGILLASFFMGILFIGSVCLIQNPMVITSRFLMIWMLLVGSTCLGQVVRK
ncbi:MAG: DUF3792 family protein [Agathobacter sp.]|nr:DUF3792 family protein [Agathobacter sp.]